MAFPGTDKSVEAFRADDTYCRQRAQNESGEKAADQSDNEANASFYQSKNRYDITYTQCMHTKGNRVSGNERPNNQNDPSLKSAGHPPSDQPVSPQDYVPDVPMDR